MFSEMNIAEVSAKKSAQKYINRLRKKAKEKIPLEKLEAAIGIEPMNKAFAEIILFTSPSYKNYQALINKPLPQKSYHSL